jgi:hypothetical protein
MINSCTKDLAEAKKIAQRVKKEINVTYNRTDFFIFVFFSLPIPSVVPPSLYRTFLLRPSLIPPSSLDLLFSVLPV